MQSIAWKSNKELCTYSIVPNWEMCHAEKKLSFPIEVIVKIFNFAVDIIVLSLVKMGFYLLLETKIQLQRRWRESYKLRR